MKKESENWSEDGDWALCKHGDCHYFIRKRGEKRRILCQIFPDRVRLKCDSCGQISTFYFEKKKMSKKQVDEPEWVPLSSMIESWEKTN